MKLNEISNSDDIQYQYDLAAVKRDMHALEHVKNPTLELCMAAVQYSGHALFHVPEHMRTPEICMAAIQQNPFALQHVPSDVMTDDMCWAAVKNEGLAIHACTDRQTVDMCVAAVNENPNALKYVRADLKGEVLARLNTKVTESANGMHYYHQFIQAVANAMNKNDHNMLIAILRKANELTISEPELTALTSLIEAACDLLEYVDDEEDEDR